MDSSQMSQPKRTAMARGRRVLVVLGAAVMLGLLGLTWRMLATSHSTPTSAHMVQFGLSPGVDFRTGELLDLPPQSWVLQGPEHADLVEEIARAVQQSRTCEPVAMMQADILFVRDGRGRQILATCSGVDRRGGYVYIGTRRSRELNDLLLRAEAEAGGQGPNPWPQSVWTTPQNKW